jgi:hypothetical protein
MLQDEIWDKLLSSSELADPAAAATSVLPVANRYRREGGRSDDYRTTYGKRRIAMHSVIEVCDNRSGMPGQIHDRRDWVSACGKPGFRDPVRLRAAGSFVAATGS